MLPFNILYEGFWLFSTNIIGLLSLYIIELIVRNNYVQSILIEKEKKETDIIKGELKN